MLRVLQQRPRTKGANHFPGLRVIVRSYPNPKPGPVPFQVYGLTEEEETEEEEFLMFSCSPMLGQMLRLRLWGPNTLKLTGTQLWRFNRIEVLGQTMDLS